MTLRKKTWLLIGGTVLVLLAVLGAISQTILLKGFEDLEKREVERNVERARNAIDEAVSKLSAFATDYGRWDDTYDFIESGRQDYIDKNFDPGSFAIEVIDYAALIDRTGGIRFGCAYDLTEKKGEPLPEEFAAALRGALIDHPTPESSRQGLLLLPGGPLLFATRPIITSEAKGPVRGAVVFAQRFDQAEIRRIGELIRLDIHVEPQSGAEPSVVAALGKEAVLVRPLDRQRVVGYARLDGLLGGPALVLSVRCGREVYGRGLQILAYALGAIFVAGLAFGLVIMLLLEKTLVERLMLLSDSVGGIGLQGDLSARVQVAGRDELGQLSARINEMLSALQRYQQEQLRLRKLEAVGVLSEGIAHDFNNVLGGVLGNVSLARTAVSGDPAEWLSEAEAGCNEAKRLVLQFLGVARTGRPTRHETEIRAVLERGVELALAGRADVEVAIEVAGEAARLEIDADQIHRVVYSLSLNAVQAMPDGGTLTIRTELFRKEKGSALPLPDGEYVRLTVRDTGGGIRAEDLGRIFDPCYTTREKGSGLGLTLCHSIVLMHGGHISVESEPGKGTAFQVHLPRFAPKVEVS